MRWYWAILITVGLLAIPFLMALNGTSDGAVDTYCKALVVLTALYAGVSAGSIGWGLFVLLLWPIGFPAFLMNTQRSENDFEGSKHSQLDALNPEAYGDQDTYREYIIRHLNRP